MLIPVSNPLLKAVWALTPMPLPKTKKARLDNGEDVYAQIVLPAASIVHINPEQATEGGTVALGI